MRNRHRWMYHMTGLPGWMRFDFSPGWKGKSPLGLDPATQYLIHGAWPTSQMNYAWQQGQVPFSSIPGSPPLGFPAPYDPWGATKITPEEEINFLKAETELLEDELFGIEKKIKKLEGKK